MIIINYNYNELIVITIIINDNSSKLLIIINDGYKEYRNPDFFLIYFKTLSPGLLPRRNQTQNPPLYKPAPPRSAYCNTKFLPLTTLLNHLSPNISTYKFFRLISIHFFYELQL